MALITATQVIDIAFTNKNTDQYLVKPAFVEIAELNFIEPAIGEKLYIKCKDAEGDISSLTSNPPLISEIKCYGANVSLHHKYIKLYSADNNIKYAVYFQVTDTSTLATLPGIDEMIPVDLNSGNGASSTADEVATALNAAISGITTSTFTSSVSTNTVSVNIPENATYPQNGNTDTSNFEFSENGVFVLTAGSNTITCPANSFIEVGDFITGTNIPLREDGTDACRPYNKVLTVDTPGGVTSFTVSGTPTVSSSTASPVFRKPIGALIVDYIVNYLAFCVKFEMLPDITYNTTSQGVVENVADFSVPVDSKKLNFLRNETFKKSESYLRKMTKFLDDNNDSFPDYCNENEGGVSKKNGIIIY